MSPAAERAVALACTVVAVIATLEFMGRATFFLNIGLVLSLLFWFSTQSTAADTFAGVLRPYLAAIVIQCCHFLEECVAGIYEQVPDLFGYALSPTRFFTFNVVWIVVFILAAVGVRARIRLALLPFWFLAIVGGIGNGVLHSAIALWRGAYFPGLVTALVAFPVGVMLLVRLIRSPGKFRTDSIEAP